MLQTLRLSAVDGAVMRGGAAAWMRDGAVMRGGAAAWMRDGAVMCEGFGGRVSGRCLN